MNNYSSRIGIAFVVCSTLISTIMNLTIRLVQADTTTIMFIRYNIAFIFLLPLLPNLFKSKCSVWLHISRTCVIFVINFLTYYGQTHASFVNVNIIGMSEPFFVLLYSAIIGHKHINKFLIKTINKLLNKNRLSTKQYDKINEVIHDIKPLTWKKFLGILIGYAGVLLIILNKTQNIDSVNTFLGNLAMIFANVIHALLLFQSRYMAVYENIKTVIIYNALILWLFSWIIAPSMSTIRSLPKTDFLILFLISIFAITTHFLNMKGLNKLKPEAYSPILYTKIIFSSILGYIVLKETINLNQIVGIILIFTGLSHTNKY